MPRDGEPGSVRQACAPTSACSDVAQPGRGQDGPSPGCRPMMARPTTPQSASADARGEPARGHSTCLWSHHTSLSEAISRASLSVSVSWCCRGSRCTSACIILRASPSAAQRTTSMQAPIQRRWKHHASSFQSMHHWSSMVSGTTPRRIPSVSGGEHTRSNVTDALRVARGGHRRAQPESSWCCTSSDRTIPDGPIRSDR